MNISAQSFLTLANDFQAVTAEKADLLLQQNDPVVVFFGRESCPYCQKFIPKLHNVSKEDAIQIYFVHTGQSDNPSLLQEVRDKYDIPTVPGLVVKSSDQLTVRCDSSLSESAIRSLLKQS